MPRTRPAPRRSFRLDFTPLRRTRRASDLSAVALAQAAGVNRVTIWRVETNRTTPTVDQLVAIARALGTPMWQLFTVLDART